MPGVRVWARMAHRWIRAARAPRRYGTEHLPRPLSPAVRLERLQGAACSPVLLVSLGATTV